jgi:hypothetical protein
MFNLSRGLSAARSLLSHKTRIIVSTGRHQFPYPYPFPSGKGKDSEIECFGGEATENCAIYLSALGAAEWWGKPLVFFGAPKTKLQLPLKLGMDSIRLSHHLIFG